MKVPGQGQARMFTDGQFYTDNGKANFIAIKNSLPSTQTSDDYPLVLNTGRIRDQWHTMTRTGKSSRLSGHIFEPYVEVHPEDAILYALEDGELAKVTSLHSDVIVRVKVTSVQRKGSLFIPMHWNDQFSSRAVVDSLYGSATDPVSGQPEYKHTAVSIQSYKAKWYGFIISRRRLNTGNATYWSLSRGKDIWRYEIAGEQVPDDWAKCARDLLCQDADSVEWTEYHDPAVNRYRAARIENGRLESCLFIGPGFALPERDYLKDLFTDEKLSDKDRSSILTGQPPIGQKDAGRVVCACFNVGINTMVDTIKSQKLTTLYLALVVVSNHTPSELTIDN